MPNTKQFIEDAIEGGWEPCDIIDDYKKIIVTHTNGGVWIKNDPEEDGCHIEHCQMLLSPLAWQAVDATRGWSDCKNMEHTNPKAECDECHDDAGTWHKNWHTFIDHLADGDDVETALSKIL